MPLNFFAPLVGQNLLLIKILFPLGQVMRQISCYETNQILNQAKYDKMVKYVDKAFFYGCGVVFAMGFVGAFGTNVGASLIKADAEAIKMYRKARKWIKNKPQ